MAQLGSSTLAGPRDAELSGAVAGTAETEERLPLPQVVLILGGASALLWLAIAAAVRWLLV